MDGVNAPFVLLNAVSIKDRSFPAFAGTATTAQNDKRGLVIG